MFAFVAIITNAQTMPYARAYKFPTVAGDTLTNVDTVSKVITASAGYSVIGIQVGLTKLSGTVAGKAYLFQSLDGLNYLLTDSASYTATPTFPATITNGAAITPTVTNIATFYKQTTPSVYYLVEVVSSGTGSAIATVSYTARQYFTTRQ